MIVKNILIADENEFIRKIISEKFQNSFDNRHYFRFLEAKDGEEALNLIGTQNVHLAVIDSNLPKISGFEVLRTIKNSTLKSHIPVIILTNNIHRATRIKAYELGAVGVVPKPFSSSEVFALIRALLRTQDEYIHFSEVIHMLSFILENSKNSINLLPKEVDIFLSEYFVHYSLVAYSKTEGKIVYNNGFEQEEIEEILNSVDLVEKYSKYKNIICIPLVLKNEEMVIIIKAFSDDKRFYLMKKVLELWSELNGR